MKKVFTIIPLFIVFFVLLESGDGNSSRLEKDDVLEANTPVALNVKKHFDSLILNRITKNFELNQIVKSKNNEYLLILKRLKNNQFQFQRCDHYVKR